MPDTHIKLFGSPTLERNGRSLHLPRRKAKALLAYLAVSQQNHSRESLITLLWPEYSVADGRADLSRTLSQLRQKLSADTILADRETVQFNSSADMAIDVVQFRAKIEESRATAVSPAQTITSLTAATSLYQADFLAGFTLPDSPAFDEWQLLQTESLRRDLAYALTQLTHAHTSQNQLAAALTTAQHLVTLDPLDEPAQRLLLDLYSRNNQRAEAHRQYQHLVQLLTDELGVDPQPETQHLYELIRQGEGNGRLIANRFRLEQDDSTRLGQGGVGDVYRGHDTHTNQPVAIKIPRPDIIAQNPELLERFVREGEALRQLNHPNIVQMISAVAENNHHYLIIEYVSGGSLHDLIAQQGTLSVAQTINIALGLADALSRAHHLNIIHRDLKPGNVLLAQDGTARLTDFGLAYLSDVPRLTQTGMLMGTISYLSPEACHGESLDSRTDIWALGIILHEMLTGQHPFQANSLPATLNAIVHQPLPDLRQRHPHLPAPLTDLIQRMLIKDHRQRLPSMRQVGAELEAIQDGRFLTPITPLTTATPHLPAFLDEETGEPLVSIRFVSRQAELARLQENLEGMMNGNGRVLFITGGAGRGKTSLLNEFTRLAQAQYPDLIVAGGVCNAYAGVGDPYLPFRELLSLLTGDVEARLKAKAMTRDQARRLWEMTPRTLKLFLEHSPHLFDVFVGGKALLNRAQTAVPNTSTLIKLQELLDSPRPTGLEQSGLFSEYTDLLQHLASERPLLLSLDDLHWADDASLGLLFHLGRRLEGSRILLIGTYRPDELVNGRDDQPHPLAKVIDELQRSFGDSLINLTAADQSEGRSFIEALLDSEPNHLSQPFRRALFQQTGGHPLFTVELLREMQSNGSLVQDGNGRWQETNKIAWDSLPTRVEAVIAQRLSRLDSSLQDILRLASVEGETFTVEVIAHITGLTRRELVEHFSRELVKQHHLLVAQGIERLDNGQMLSRYRFHHNLFQRHLYHSLDEIERVYQHEAVGNSLENLYGEQVGEIAAQLARHFEAAGLMAKAVAYLWRAGERSIRLSAYDEAIESLNRGLTLVDDLPKTIAAEQQRIELLLALGEAAYRAGEITKSLTVLQQAADIAREHSLPEELARAALGYENSRWRFNLPVEPAAMLLQEALATFGQAETVLKVRVWINLVRTQTVISSPEQLAVMMKQVLTMARRINDPVSLFDALYLIVRSDRRPSQSAERLVMLQEIMQLAQNLGDQGRIYETYGFRLQEFMEIGDVIAFEQDHNISVGLAQKLRQPAMNYFLAQYPLALAIFSGDFAQAEKHAQDALALGHQTGVESADGVYSLQIFSIRREQGRLSELAPLIRLLVGHEGTTNSWQPGLALICSELNMRVEAQQAFENLAADDFSALVQDALWITSMTYIAEICTYLGDESRAAVLYQHLLPYNGRAIVVGYHTICYGAAARYLGMLATTMQRWLEAEQHFIDALEMNTRMTAYPWLAHTQHQYALMLLARNEKDDKNKAISLLKEALATAQELGMKALTEKIHRIGLDEIPGNV